MGLGIFGRSGNRAEEWSGRMVMRSAGNSAPQPPEPNPKQFKILNLHEINGWTVAIIHYPGCTTHKGKKCLVFACDAKTVRNQAILDPHFLERNDRLSPVARFEPTKRGIALAKKLCQK